MAEPARSRGIRFLRISGSLVLFLFLAGDVRGQGDAPGTPEELPEWGVEQKRRPRVPRPKRSITPEAERKVVPVIRIEAESFQEKGGWTEGSEGETRVLVKARSEAAAVATSSFELDVPARYRIWVRARRVGEGPAQCELSINRFTATPLTFSDAKDFTWLSGGVQSIDDGSVDLKLSAPAASAIQVDGVLLATDFTYSPAKETEDPKR